MAIESEKALIMSTPMRHVPSQQGRTPSQLAGATPPVSTPFSNPATAAFSPRGPRSSPHHPRKSPANSSTIAGQSSQNGGINFDSPSTAAAIRALDMGSGFGFGLDNVAVGQLDGLGGFSGGDDKIKRLDTILKLLDKKGFVSEAGIARLAQRSGLELLSEDSTGPDGKKGRTLVIAGSVTLAIDIVLEDNIVRNISLAFHESPPSVTEHAEAAGAILLADLQLLPNQSPLTKTLDNFAANFERLANLDKLSISPGLDCQEALAGIFVSLGKLHEWEVARLKEEPGGSSKPNEHLSAMALCTRSGKPVMHSRGKVGVALQYWKDSHLVHPSTAKIAAYRQRTEKVWSLLLGCAAIDHGGLLPVRVSENWISNDIVKIDDGMDSKIAPFDWLEPDNVVLSSSEETKDTGMEMLQSDLSTARVPRVMFTATFDPPVILPQNEWARLYSIANLEPPNIGMNDFNRPSPPTFDSLFFPIAPGVKVDPSETRSLTRWQTVTSHSSQHDGSGSSYCNTLFIYKPIYSQTISEIPFSHPRQLVEMMPLLRQFAFLATLLENSFGNKKTYNAVPKSSSTLAIAKTDSMTTKADELRDFLNGTDSTQQDGVQSDKNRDAPINLDVILNVHPVPQLQVVFPFMDSTANISVQISIGGVVEVLSENVLRKMSPLRTEKLDGLTSESLGKALQRLEDLGSWAEWIRTRLS